GGTPLIPHNEPAVGTNRDFGNVNAGSASAPLTIDVSNTGNTDLTISAIVLQGNQHHSHFQLDLTGWTTNQVIASGVTMSFDVTFVPTSAGLKDDAYISIGHND